ncbi:MAG: hypothetical protein HY904_01610 [Deltaproteobacteria bacterium]|nr:hypothetical protein [Deltaproteobacteria bacterium]
MTTQWEIYRRMTPYERLQQAFKLRQMAWNMRASWTRLQHPEWTEEQVQKHVAEVFLYART